ncbi:MAG TPA: hypothetical protein VIU41_05265 [Geobacteraceae bacterium]
MSMVIPLLQLTILLLVTANPACAQEFFAFGGLMRDRETHERSYSWQLDYREGIGEHFAYSIAYLNEGHVPSHHRDGHTMQLWARSDLLSSRLSLAAGIGPFFYFDTVPAKEGASYTNTHGWGGILSMSATWYTESRWLLQLRTNFVETGSSINTFSTLLGIGYQLEAPPAAGSQPVAHEQTDKTANELTFFFGKTIVNSLSSDESYASSIEYRRRLWRYVDGTAAWLYEGDNRLARRNGLATQLWAVKEFLDDQVALGIGGGAYFSIDDHGHAQQHGNHNPSGIVTLTATYRFAPPWNIRASWHRIVTNYDADADVILGGIGYRF